MVAVRCSIDFFHLLRHLEHLCIFRLYNDLTDFYSSNDLLYIGHKTHNTTKATAVDGVNYNLKS